MPSFFRKQDGTLVPLPDDADEQTVIDMGLLDDDAPSEAVSRGTSGRALGDSFFGLNGPINVRVNPPKTAVGQVAESIGSGLFGIDPEPEFEPVQPQPRRGDANALFAGLLSGGASLGDVVNTVNPFQNVAELFGAPDTQLRDFTANVGDINPAERAEFMAGQSLGGGLGATPLLRGGRALIGASRVNRAADVPGVTGARVAENNPALTKTKPLPVSLEAASLGGAAIGAGAAEEAFPGDPLVAIGAELTGSILSPAVLATRIIGVPASTLGRKSVNFLKNMISSQTGLVSANAAERRAAVAVVNNFKAQGVDPNLAIEVIETAANRNRAVPDFTLDVKIAGQGDGDVARRTANALTLMRNSLAAKNPGLKTTFDAQNAAAIEATALTAEKLARSENPGALKDAATLYRSVFESTIRGVRDRAIQNAKDAAAELGTDPALQQKAAGEALTKAADDALEAGRAFERAVWAPINRETKVGAIKVANAFDAAKSDVLPGRGVLDPISQRFIEQSLEDGKTTVGNLLALRSDVLEQARVLASNQQFNAARLARKVADAVLEDLADVPGTEAARTVSREFNDVFTRTFIGDLDRLAKTGSERIDPAVAASKVLTTSDDGAQRLVRAQEVRDAAGFDPNTTAADLSGVPGLPSADETAAAAAERLSRAQSALESSTNAQRVTGGVDPITGRANPESIASDLRLTQSAGLPQSQQLGERVVATELAARGAEDVAKKRLSEIDSSFLGELTNNGGKAPSVIVKEALKQPNAEQRIARLANVTRQSGLSAEQKLAAANDLRAGAFGQAIDAATSKSGAISFQKLQLELLGETRNRKSLLDLMVQNKIVAPQTAKEVTGFVRTIARQEKQLANRDVDTDLLSSPTPVLDFLQRVIGARTAAIGLKSVTGGPVPIQATGAGAKLAQTLFKRLPGFKVNDALERALSDPSPDFIILLRDAARNTGKLTIPQRQRFSRVTAGLVSSGLLSNDEFEQIEAEADALANE